MCVPCFGSKAIELKRKSQTKHLLNLLNGKYEGNMGLLRIWTA